MADIALGHGSKWQLSRYLGWHRNALNAAIRLLVPSAEAVEWLDFPSGDAEWESFDFMDPDGRGIRDAWRKVWPHGSRDSDVGRSGKDPVRRGLGVASCRGEGAYGRTGKYLRCSRWAGSDQASPGDDEGGPRCVVGGRLADTVLPVRQPSGRAPLLSAEQNTREVTLHLLSRGWLPWPSLFCRRERLAIRTGCPGETRRTPEGSSIGGSDTPTVPTCSSIHCGICAQRRREFLELTDPWIPLRPKGRP